MSDQVCAFNHPLDSVAARRTDGTVVCYGCLSIADLQPSPEHCRWCGHLLSQHDPSDGSCDQAHPEDPLWGTCPCGRNMGVLRYVIEWRKRQAIIR